MAGPKICLFSLLVTVFIVVTTHGGSSVSQSRSDKWRTAPAGKRVNINGKEYIFGDQESNGSLTDAHNYCNTRNMLLVAFDTENEFEQVRQYIQTEITQNITAYWTSGFRAGDTDIWYWTSNKEIFDPNLLYWRSDSPRQGATWDACVAIKEPTFEWVDETLGMCEFGYIRHFICEAF